MVGIQLKKASEEFVHYLRSSQELKEFKEAKAAFDKDPEIMKLHQEITTLAHEFNKKQNNKTLRQSDIDRMRLLQQKLNSHPKTVRYTQTRQQLAIMLQECNSIISGIIGFNFAATIAPKAGCC
ncbi:MAG: YlbF family regulator [Deltaproteobacteria bacterium]|nr:YlbF family regulator [Deltaproteobacteria bacterium]